jgi:N-acetylneuraminic acid mutarotase
MMNRLLLIITILCFAQSPVFSQWWKTEGEMPHPVAGGEAVVINNYIYIIGGYSDSTQSNVNWIQRYNPETREWRFAGETLYPRFGLAAGVYNNKITVFGGLEDTTEIVNSLEIWDPFDTTKAELILNNPLFNRLFPAAVIDGDRFYIFGGNSYPGTTDNSSYFTVFNFADSSFISDSIAVQFEGEFPEQQMAVKLGDKIHLFGGVFFGISQNIYQFDTETNAFFESSSKLLEPRANGEAVEINSEIYLIGGYNESIPALRNVEVLMPADSAYHFQIAPELNIPRRNLMAVNYSDKIYVFGGFDENGNVVSEVESYNPTAIVGVKNKNLISEAVKVYQNYPNPFNPETRIKFEILSSGSGEENVQLKVFDILGNEIETLVNENKQPGIYEVKFDARKYASGVYFYQLKSDYKTFTKKMIIAK